MSELTILVLLTLATYRVTRLVVHDTFPLVARPLALLLGPDGRKLAGTRLAWLGELLTCHWCVAVWVAAGLTFAAHELLVGGLAAPWLVWPAVAAAAGIVAQLVDGE